MSSKTEWAIEGGIDVSVLEFPNFGDKFETAMEHDLDMLFFTFQVPEVLMGRGNIPEGIAKVQMDAFERRAASFQSEMEKIIERS